MLLGFVALDVVYSAVVINYCVQCALLIFYIEGLQEQLRQSLYSLKKGFNVSHVALLSLCCHYFQFPHVNFLCRRYPELNLTCDIWITTQLLLSPLSCSILPQWLYWVSLFLATPSSWLRSSRTLPWNHDNLRPYVSMFSLQVLSPCCQMAIISRWWCTFQLHSLWFSGSPWFLCPLCRWLSMFQARLLSVSWTSMHLHCQAARLSAGCNSLRKLGHELRVRPFGYRDTSDQELDSFLLYTSSLNLRVSIYLTMLISAVLDKYYSFAESVLLLRSQDSIFLSCRPSYFSFLFERTSWVLWWSSFVFLLFCSSKLAIGICGSESWE